jgi:hypothetical protein
MSLMSTFTPSRFCTHHDAQIRVEGYKAFTTTRYEVAERHEGGADFTIWEKGAAEYWANITTK